MKKKNSLTLGKKKREKEEKEEKEKERKKDRLNQEIIKIFEEEKAKYYCQEKTEPTNINENKKAPNEN